MLFNNSSKLLEQKFEVEPFSVLNTRSSEWLNRKRLWKLWGIDGNYGMIKNDLFDSILDFKEKRNIKASRPKSTGSTFDPVLVEIMYNWFCPKGGIILDPFAGSATSGLIAYKLGFKFYGIEIRKEQVEANLELLEKMELKDPILNKDLRPEWILGDSTEIDLFFNKYIDFFFSCPPYGNLIDYNTKTNYSNLSSICNFSYTEFMAKYDLVIKKCTNLLKPGRFAAYTICNFRDKNGYYYNFLGDTIESFKNNGCYFYNDFILLNSITIGFLIAHKQFNSGKKVFRTHQNTLVFVKNKK